MRMIMLRMMGMWGVRLTWVELTGHLWELQMGWTFMLRFFKKHFIPCVPNKFDISFTKVEGYKVFQLQGEV